MSEEVEAREDEGILTRVSKSWEKNYVFTWLDVNVEREDQRTLWEAEKNHLLSKRRFGQKEHLLAAIFCLRDQSR